MHSLGARCSHKVGDGRAIIGTFRTIEETNATVGTNHNIAAELEGILGWDSKPLHALQTQL